MATTTTTETTKATTVCWLLCTLCVMTPHNDSTWGLLGTDSYMDSYGRDKSNILLFIFNLLP